MRNKGGMEKLRELIKMEESKFYFKMVWEKKPYQTDILLYTLKIGILNKNSQMKQHFTTSAKSKSIRLL